MRVLHIVIGETYWSKSLANLMVRAEKLWTPSTLCYEANLGYLGCQRGHLLIEFDLTSGLDNVLKVGDFSLLVLHHIALRLLHCQLKFLPFLI